MGKQRNKAEFIEVSEEKHRDKNNVALYDYSLVIYIKSNIKVKIRCKKHDLIFEQTPNHHLMGHGCNECGKERTANSRKYTLEEVLNKAVEVHGDLYDYSYVIFKSMKDKVKIRCKKHNFIFEQTFAKHIYGSGDGIGQGCPKCARELFHYNELTTETFIKKTRPIHGDRYDYTQVDYKGSSVKVKIRCKKHDLIFEMTPNNHLRGGNCYLCAIEENGLRRRLTTEDFIVISEKVHGKLYDYSVTEYVDSHTKVKIRCRIHGIFLQLPTSHYCGKGKGCPSCRQPRGEKLIASLLDLWKITYERGKSFDGLRNKRPLRYDFFIPSSNICIEFDGKQHFEPSKHFGGEPVFELQKKLDAIKNEYCLKNGIKLIRIPYTKKDHEIEAILKEAFNIP